MARKFDIPSLQCVMTWKKFGIKLPGKTAFFSAGHQVACRDTKKNVQNWRISRWSKNCQLPAIDKQLQMYRKSHRSKRLNTISGTGFSISINEVNSSEAHKLSPMSIQDDNNKKLSFRRDDCNALCLRWSTQTERVRALYNSQGVYTVSQKKQDT